jgi:hypothetical protein
MNLNSRMNFLTKIINKRRLIWSRANDERSRVFSMNEHTEVHSIFINKKFIFVVLSRFPSL